MVSTLRRVVLGAACLASAATAALAGSFEVSPQRVEITATHTSQVLRVTNRGTEPATMQAQALKWSFSGEEDVFGDTDDVVLNPPVFTLAPSATQFVRLGLRPRTPSGVEASYRLFVEELPPESKPGEMTVRTLMRVSLPIFVAPAGGKAAARLEWRVARAGTTDVRLSATNTGNAHIKLSRISLRVEGADAVATQNLAAYLLPGQTREWRIPGKALAAAAQIELSAQGDAGEISERLVPTDP